MWHAYSVPYSLFIERSIKAPQVGLFPERNVKMTVVPPKQFASPEMINNNSLHLYNKSVIRSLSYYLLLCSQQNCEVGIIIILFINR